MANNPLAQSCFWADVEQAQERLVNSLVLYDDQPAYVIEVTGGFGDGIPRANLYLGTSREATRKRLDSPKFKRFRELAAGAELVSGVFGTVGPGPEAA